MGPQLGIDADGYPIYDGNLDRFYTPLTPAQLDSMLGRIVHNPESHNGTQWFTVTNPNLFERHGGGAGTAGTAESVSQGSNHTSATPERRRGGKNGVNKG